MVWKSLEIEESVAGRLKDIFAHVSAVKSENLSRNIRVGSIEMAIKFQIEFNSRQYEILVDVQPDGAPSTLRKAAGRLKANRAFVSGEANPYLALGAPYITNAGIDVCREERIGCIDAAGNCYLSFGGMHIEIRGNKNLEPAIRSSKFLFSPKSSRIIRVLLSESQKWWQVQELAREAQISIGLVSRLKKKMLEEELIVEADRRVRVKSPERLVGEWAQQYSYKRNKFKEFYSLLGGPEAEKQIADYCNQRNIPYALGMFSAASRVAPHVHMNKIFAFVDGDLSAVARDLQFKAVPSGSNLMLLKPYDDGVFYKSRVVAGLRIVSDVQIYVDLKTYKGRGEEAADFLMENLLEPSWQRNQNTGNER
jgi:hypothetical protein